MKKILLLSPSRKENRFPYPTLQQGDLRVTATMEYQSHSAGHGNVGFIRLVDKTAGSLRLNSG
jgi:hypothetical protein